MLGSFPAPAQGTCRRHYSSISVSPVSNLHVIDRKGGSSLQASLSYELEGQVTCNSPPTPAQKPHTTTLIVTDYSDLLAWKGGSPVRHLGTVLYLTLFMCHFTL